MQKRISRVHVIILAGKYDASTKHYMPYNSANQLFYIITFLLIFVIFFFYENCCSLLKSYLYKTIYDIVDQAVNHTTFVVLCLYSSNRKSTHRLAKNIHARIYIESFSDGFQI